MEKILCAAIHWQNDKIYRCQPKNIESGYVALGRRHDSCYSTLQLICPSLEELGEHVQGFLTSDNRFVDRKKAAQIAFKAGQIADEIRALISEDLY